MRIVVEMITFVGIKTMMEDGYTEFHIDMKEPSEETKCIADEILFNLVSFAVIASKEAKDWYNKKGKV